MRVRRYVGAAGLAGILLACPAAPAVEPVRIARLGSERFRQADGVEAIGYSPDGKTLVTAGNNALHFWDAADGRRLRSVAVDNATFFALRFTPDGRTLYAAAVAGGYTRLCRIDPAAGKLTEARPVIAGRADGRFSPDGAWLAVREAKGRFLEMVESATGQVRWTEPGGGAFYHALAFRGDGGVLAVGTSMGRVRLHDPKTGKILHDNIIASGAVWNMTFSPDGKDLVAEISSPAPNHVARFDAATGQVRWKHNTNRAKELAFTPDGSQVFYYGTRGPRRTDPARWHWLDAATGKPTDTAMDAESGHTRAVRSDGKVLAIGGFHGHLSQWDLTTRKRLDGSSADPPDPVIELRFLPDGSKVRGFARGWYEWDVKTGQQTRLTPRLDVGTWDTIAVSDDQKWLARMGWSPDPARTIELTDLTTGQRKHSLAGFTAEDRAQFLSDGRLAVVGPDGLRLFDPASGKRLAEISARPRDSVVVSADGTTAAVLTPLDEAAQVVRWDLKAGRPTVPWTGSVTHRGKLERLMTWDGSLSPDGRLLLIQFTFLESQNVRRHRVGVFDLANGRRLSEWDPPVQFTPAFSPDGRMVACLSQTVYGIELRETATGGRRGWLARSPHACRFSPDGRLLSVSAPPGPVELRDLFGPAPGPWAGRKPADLWDALAGPAAQPAFDAVAFLRAHPAEAVALLKEQMPVPAAPAADWVTARLNDLDAATFRRREQATRDLAAAGEAVVGALREAQGKASAEARERLAGLIAKADGLSPDKLRAVRACEVLEGIGTPEAQALLAAWARGPAGTTLTREAGASLERLKSR